MKRIVRPELLDTLSPEDSRAVSSRGDLHRVNICMRNHALMADALRNVLNPGLGARITELGAGDGRFFLYVADRLRRIHWLPWPVEVTGFGAWHSATRADPWVAKGLSPITSVQLRWRWT